MRDLKTYVWKMMIRRNMVRVTKPTNFLAGNVRNNGVAMPALRIETAVVDAVFLEDSYPFSQETLWWPKARHASHEMERSS
jgi:hypothetical protein